MNLNQFFKQPSLSSHLLGWGKKISFITLKMPNGAILLLWEAGSHFRTLLARVLCRASVQFRPLSVF